MGLNLKKFEKTVRKVLEKDYGFELSFEKKDDCTIFKSEITLNTIDDSIYLEVDGYEFGGFYIDFILDKLEINDTTLKLLHDFNERALFLKATVTSNGYLKISYSMRGATDDIIEPTIYSILNRFSGDKMGEVLKPLAALTYTDN